MKEFYNKIKKKKTMKKKIKLISIEDVKNDTKEIKINSPRTLKAMHHLNYTNEDLFYYDFKHYRLDKNTKIVGDPVDIQKRKYKLFLEKRKKIIEEIKNLRNEIISKGEDILYIKSKSSSKIIRISRWLFRFYSYNIFFLNINKIV